MPPITPFLDPTRFDTLSEGVVLRRIGGLLATALVRSGRLLPRRGEKVGASPPSARTTVDPWDMVSDPIERQLVRFLHHAGPTAPRDLATAIGISRRTTVRKLARLRASGICAVAGRTRGVVYRLRSDYGRN